MVVFDKTEIRNALSIENIFDLLQEWGGDPIYTDFGLLSATICHNTPGEGSKKLYFYENSKLFYCYTGCDSSFDIFELTIKVFNIQYNKKMDLNDAVRYIAARMGIAGRLEDAPDTDKLIDWDILSNYDRIQNIKLNNQNLIEQFLSVSDVLSEFIIELSKIFKEVHVYVTPGNHSRISPKKEDNLKGENFDNLLIPFLSERLQNLKNIHCHKNEIIEDIAMFNIRGNKIFSSHGDKDRPENVVQRLTLLFNVVPDIVYLGHRHRNGLSTVYNTKIVETGCISGVDDHTLDDLRVNTRPEQTVSVITEEGLECLYDIQLD